jgi:hypothetical protein
MLEKLRTAGMNIVRMNFSHGSYEYHQSVIDNVRKCVAGECFFLEGGPVETKGQGGGGLFLASLTTPTEWDRSQPEPKLTKGALIPEFTQPTPTVDLSRSRLTPRVQRSEPV